MSVNFFPETVRASPRFTYWDCGGGDLATRSNKRHDPVQEKMQRSLEQRMAIKFCVKLEKSAAETILMLKKAFGVDCLSGRLISRPSQKVGKMSTTRTALDGHQPPVPTTM
ncbi:hypothetical protein NQ318_017404 [Aromia moschata]|uniref:Uncharacterized protein n=1 Tax=Aromia moschata TaxID=1265417 RepID=A0AAV8Z3X5_9CUCU|nr:hypothetical protein NQ318_017404 [Aromia moschata]